MSENPNPYMDPNFNPNGGYMPNNAQSGFADMLDPFAQQADWSQIQSNMAADQQGFAPGAQNGIFDDYVSPGNMMSAQDIYANQAAQSGGSVMPGMVGADYGMGANGYYGDPAAMGAYGAPSVGMGYDAMDAFAGQQMGAIASDPFSNDMFGMQQTGGNYVDPYQAQMGGVFGQMPASQAPVGSMGADMQFQASQVGAFEQTAQVQQQPSANAADAAFATQQFAAVAPSAGAPVANASAAPASEAQGARGSSQGSQATASSSVQQSQQPQASSQQPAPSPQQSTGRTQQQQPAASMPESDSGSGRHAASPQRGQMPPQGMPRRPIMPPVNSELASPAKAKKSLILAILSIVFSLLAPVGFVLALLAMHSSNSYRRNGGRSNIGEMARVFSIAGLVFSGLMLALLIWFFGYYLGYGEWAFMFVTPIDFFNNSPLGQVFSLPDPSR